jgi:DNA-binding NarL/FixJ family response regulator
LCVRAVLAAMIRSLRLDDSEAAMTGPAAVEIVLSETERSELKARVRRRKIARVDATRAAIVLLAADGLNNCAIADEIGVSRMTVLTWR